MGISYSLTKAKECMCCHRVRYGGGTACQQSFQSVYQGPIVWEQWRMSAELIGSVFHLVQTPCCLRRHCKMGRPAWETIPQYRSIGSRVAGFWWDWWKGSRESNWQLSYRESAVPVSPSPLAEGEILFKVQMSFVGSPFLSLTIVCTFGPNFILHLSYIMGKSQTKPALSSMSDYMVTKFRITNRAPMGICGVGLSLLTVVFSSKKAWDALGTYLLTVMPPDIPLRDIPLPPLGQCCGCTGLCGSYYDHRDHLCQTIRELKKTRFIAYKPWREHRKAENHTQKVVDREGEKVQTWGSPFVWVQEWNV